MHIASIYQLVLLMLCCSEEGIFVKIINKKSFLTVNCRLVLFGLGQSSKNSFT
jgi:hypothetical protein